MLLVKFSLLLFALQYYVVFCGQTSAVNKGR